MELPLFRLVEKNKTKILLGVMSFWLIIGGMIYLTEEVIAARYFGTRALDKIEKMQYMVRWLIWPLLTPLIIFVALKLSFKRQQIIRFVLLHIVLGTAFLVFEYLLEISIIKFFAWQLYQQIIPVKDYTVPFLFKYWAYISIYFLIVGIVNVFVYLHKYQLSETSLMETDLKNKQLEYDLALAQLNSLKMQLQPHFLFNTHNSIISLMLQNEPEKAIHMLTKLSGLLRLTIDKSEVQVITLQEELEYMKLYLDIQHIRFQDRLKIEFDILPELNQFMVPTFILQPLIENAITHGIAPYSDSGLIKIYAGKKENTVVLSVSDDGQGLTDTSYESAGIGIQNTRKRLAQLYGKDCRLILKNNAVKGVSSSIEIYLHKD